MDDEGEWNDVMDSVAIEAGAGGGRELTTAEGRGGAKIGIEGAVSTSFSVVATFSLCCVTFFSLSASAAAFFSLLSSNLLATTFPANPTAPFQPPSSFSFAPAGSGRASTTRSAFSLASASFSILSATSCFHPIGLLRHFALALQVIPTTTLATPTLAITQSLTTPNVPPTMPLLSPSPATRTRRTPRNPVPQFGPRKGSVDLKSRFSRGTGSESSERITTKRTRQIET